MYRKATIVCASFIYVHVRVTDIRLNLETLHLNQRSSTPQIVMLVMALLHYFQSMASLPTAKETTLIPRPIAFP